ncbi:MAG: hypothetical protein II680_05055 [Clostridia bacterium]|nr:hypothetical protein [Clostridia bacterium]
MEICTGDVDDNCDHCPYSPEYGKSCIGIEATRDALVLLKKEEPRVMAREEVIDLPQGSVVWYEEKSESGSFLRAMISDGNGFLGDFYLGVNANEIELKRQRFWTSRPTEEQRKAVKWDD